MGASAAAPPYLKHPRRTFCQHQSSTPFLQTPRKNQWKQSYAPLAERELEESQWRSFSKDTLTVALFNSKDFFFLQVLHSKDTIPAKTTIKQYAIQH
jgi:hypothetical protein